MAHNFFQKMKARNVIWCSWLVVQAGCGLLPDRHIGYHDARLVPFLKAMEFVNRDSLGFTPIQESDRIELEGSSNVYDAMLHVYGNTSRTVAFKKVGDKYIWIGEQEIHTGPKKYTTPDGIINEEIIVTFDKERISGVPLNQLDIDYQGPDSMLAHFPNKLNLTVALKTIRRWKKG